MQGQTAAELFFRIIWHSLPLGIAEGGLGLACL